jgi:hypothetical protein
MMMRPRIFSLVWPLLGLAATLIPLILIWHVLDSNYAGGDGKLHLTLISAYQRFGGWGAIITRDPLEGAWNIGIPINVWLNPAIVPFSFMSVKDAKVWSGAICYICYAASGYFLLRSVGVPVLRSVVISQFAFVAFDPFYYVFGWPANFALRPWVSLLIGLALLAASLLVRIDGFRAGAVAASAAAIAVMLSYGIDLDIVWSVSLLATIAFPLAVIASERGLQAATAARWSALILAFGLVYAAGPGRFLFALASNSARYREPALNTYGQVPDMASTVFDYPQTKYVFGVLIIGWGLGLVLSRGRARLLPVVGAVSFAAQLLFTIVFLFADVRWVLPPPVYYQMALTPFYVLGAGVGYAELLSRAWTRVWNYWQRPATFDLRTRSAVTIVASLVCLLPVPCYLFYTWAKPGELKEQIEPWISSDEMFAFLAQRLSLVPDPHFRGSTVISSEDYIGSLTQDSLLRASIPTLNDYNELVTEQMFVTLQELLFKGTPRGWTNRLPLEFQPAPQWAKAYVKVTGALGAKFVLSRQPLDFSGALAPGMASFNERKFRVDLPPDTWHVYELPMTNTGNYSPTVLYKLATAAEMLDKMAAPEFDFRRDAVIADDDVGETLVPLKEMRLSFGRGSARVQGTSDGTSLALLPLQYSRCLHLSDPNARLVRTDLMMIGVLFKGNVDAEITDELGLFSPGCLAADSADIGRLKIAVGPFTSPPGSRRPTAIRNAADLLPNIRKVWGDIK